MIETLDGLLANPRTAWGVGVFGAIGEFMRDADEAVARPAPHAWVTARGGIAIDPACPGARLLAWTEPSSLPGQWRQGAALCLPVPDAAIGGTSVVTEIGPDRGALRAEDRGDILFDMGVGFAHLRACIRTRDAWIIEQVRAGIGRPLFGPGNPALGAIIATSPHRVFLSRLARIEVFQPIPPPDGTSPEGPHTHFLPKLLAAKRAHPATRPMPDGLVSALDIFPAHPLRDAMGRPTAFDTLSHDAFAALLARYGLGALETVRGEAIRAIRAGTSPTGFTAPQDRFARATLKVALRQLAQTEPRLPALKAWREAFDRGDAAEPAGDPFHPD